jgi:hypothetical protein
VGSLGLRLYRLPILLAARTVGLTSEDILNVLTLGIIETRAVPDGTVNSQLNQRSRAG